MEFRAKIKKRHHFLLLEILVAMMIWSLTSPWIWQVNMKQFRQICRDIYFYEKTLLVREARFYIHSGEHNDQLNVADIDFWNRFKSNAKKPKAAALPYQLIMKGELSSWNAGQLNAPSFRVYAQFYKVKQTPKREREPYKAWRRLIQCDYKVYIGDQDVYEANDLFTLVRNLSHGDK